MSKLNLGSDLYIKGRIGWRGLSKDEYLKHSKYKIINATALMDGYVDWDNCGFISKERYEESDEIMLQENDILISKDGTLGKIGYVKGLTTPCTVASGIFVLRNIMPDNLSFDYLYHVLKSNIFKNFINRNKAAGSTINHLYQRDLENFKLDLPDIKIQNKIAGVLNVLDEKISNNNKINAELESIAKTIYDYWFLQFDFPDKNGKPYKSSGGKMVWNEELKREIPEGWGTVLLGDITVCHDSKRIPLSGQDRENKKGCIPYYGATGIMDYVNEAIFDGDYVLVAEDGSVMNSSGGPILQRITGKAWVNNHAHVLEPSKGHCCKLIMLMLKDVQVVTIKTGSIQMKINQKKMNGIVLPDIPKELMEKANAIFSEIDNKILQINKVNQDLASLRDFLLPLLMNGQVGFKDLESVRAKEISLSKEDQLV